MEIVCRRRQLEAIESLSNAIIAALNRDELAAALELDIERGELMREALSTPQDPDERAELMGRIQAIVDADRRIRQAMVAARRRLSQASGAGAMRIRAARAYQEQ